MALSSHWDDNSNQWNFNDIFYAFVFLFTIEKIIWISDSNLKFNNRNHCPIVFAMRYQSSVYTYMHRHISIVFAHVCVSVYVNVCFCMCFDRLTDRLHRAFVLVRRFFNILFIFRCVQLIKKSLFIHSTDLIENRWQWMWSKKYLVKFKNNFFVAKKITNWHNLIN